MTSRRHLRSQDRTAGIEAEPVEAPARISSGERPPGFPDPPFGKVPSPGGLIPQLACSQASRQRETSEAARAGRWPCAGGRGLGPRARRGRGHPDSPTGRATNVPSGRRSSASDCLIPGWADSSAPLLPGAWHPCPIRQSSLRRRRDGDPRNPPTWADSATRPPRLITVPQEGSPRSPQPAWAKIVIGAPRVMISPRGLKS